MSRFTRVPAVLLVCSTAWASQQSESKQAPPRRFHPVAPATSAIRVDGVLNEQAWQDATRIPLLYEWLPGDNVPPPVRTECLVTFDAHNLYVGFRASDPAPGRIRAHLTDRDVPFLDDTVGFMLDPFNDQRRAFQFRINPLGVQMDATNSDVDQSEDWSWDAIWESVGGMTEEGYVVEVAVPFTSLRFPNAAGPQTWGFVATRDYPRSLRHRIQSGWRDRNKSCLICQFDAITGLQGIRPGLSLEMDPTLTGTQTDIRSDFPAGSLASGDQQVEGGLTARWGVTPNLALNAAVNPDFSHVEADVAQLAVNERFALFFPEKRPFFLEGADFFGTPIQAVFTRTVANPLWGLKLSGKEQQHAGGIFFARDRINNLIFPANQGSRLDSIDQPVNSAVARYRLDVGKTSTVGLLLTDREGGGYSNRLGGLDGVLRLTSSDTVRIQYLRSQTEYPEEVAARHGQPSGSFEDDAFHVAYTHGDRNWFWTAQYRSFGPEFRADSGFVPRVDFRRVAGGVERTVWGKPGQRFSRLFFGLFHDRTEDFSGRLTDEGWDITFGYLGPLQSVVQLNLAPNREFFNGVTHDNFRTNFAFQIRPSGDLAFTLSGTVGKTIDFANSRQADMAVLVPQVEFSLARRINGALTHTFQQLEVEPGRLFDANLTQGRIVYHFNIRTFVRAILQYTNIDRNTAVYTFPIDPKTERLFSQYLFSYKLNPQTVFLLGYSDNFLGLEQVDLTQTDRTLFLKIGYAWVF